MPFESVVAVVALSSMLVALLKLAAVQALRMAASGVCMPASGSRSSARTTPDRSVTATATSAPLARHSANTAARTALREVTSPSLDCRRRRPASAGSKRSSETKAYAARQSHWEKTRVAAPITAVPAPMATRSELTPQNRTVR